MSSISRKVLDLLQTNKGAYRYTELYDILKDISSEQMQEVLQNVSDDNLMTILFNIDRYSYGTKDVLKHISDKGNKELLKELVNHQYIHHFFLDSLHDIYKVLPVVLPIMLSKNKISLVYETLDQIFRSFDEENTYFYRAFSHLIVNTLEERGFNIRKEMKKYIKELEIDGPERNIIWRGIKLLEQYKNYSPWSSLKNNVVGSTSKYVWDYICGKNSSNITFKDLQNLRKFAAAQGIVNSNLMNHRQICAELSKVVNDNNVQCDPSDVDPWTMENMSEIPKERWYKIGNNCFDIDSLHEAIKQGIRTNPFDRTTLNTVDIGKRYNFLQNTSRTNKIEELKKIPMPSKEQYTNQILLATWSHMHYPIPITDFLKASENELDKVMESLKMFPVITLKNQELEKYDKSENRDQKFDTIVSILLRLSSLPENEYTKTMYTAIEVSLNDNIKVKRRRDENDIDDEHITQRRRISSSSGGKRRRTSRKKTKKRRMTSRKRKSKKRTSKIRKSRYLRA